MVKYELLFTNLEDFLIFWCILTCCSRQNALGDQWSNEENSTTSNKSYSSWLTNCKRLIKIVPLVINNYNKGGTKLTTHVYIYISDNHRYFVIGFFNKCSV